MATQSIPLREMVGIADHFSFGKVYGEYLWRYLPAEWRAQGRDSLTYDVVQLINNLLDELDEKGQAMADLLDPQKTRSEFLPWLADWLNYALEANWPDQKRRDLLSNLPYLYRTRGLAEGIAKLIEIYAGIRPTIYPGHQATPAVPLHLNIVLRTRTEPTTAFLNDVETLARRQAAAWTTLNVQAQWSRWQIGVTATVGADTFVG